MPATAFRYAALCAVIVCALRYHDFLKRFPTGSDVEDLYKNGAGAGGGGADAALEISAGAVDENSSIAISKAKASVDLPPVNSSDYTSRKQIADEKLSGTLSAAQSSESRVSPVPRGLRLVMMGDSLTRYQYLSLTYFLKNGFWIDPSGPDRKYIREKSFSGWADFYNSSTKALAPMEYCDCYRSDAERSAHEGDTVENRYFYDKERDNRVTFLTAFGHALPMHGRWNTSTVNMLASSPWQNNLAEQGLAKRKKVKDFIWSFKSWKDAVEEYASSFGAKHLMFNAGWWLHKFHKDKFRGNFTEALHKHGIQPIWRTTTFNRNHSLEDQKRRTRDDIVRLAWCGDNRGGPNATLCIDARWTKRVSTNHYWDNLHFLEPVYRVMNEELLELTGHVFPSTYVKQPRDVLLQGYDTTA